MNASLASIDEAARRQYELAWKQGRPESIERFLPPPDHVQYQATSEELVMIEIEMSWKAWASQDPGGDRRDHNQAASARPLPDLIEAYLNRFPTLQHSDIIQRLIEQECIARRAAGQVPQEHEYQLRFPGARIQASLFQTEPDATLKHIRQPTTAMQQGSQLGRYQLLHEHSRGSFGIVWKAEDTMLGRSVALKQLKEYLANKPEYRHRFLAEAKITAQLQHPGIVPIHEVGGEAEGCPYYTMNMVGGETLAEAIETYHQKKALPAERALQWQRLITAYLAVVRTMAFAHNQGIIHRDLKPANIILGKYGETLILDWGLAKVLHQDEAQESQSESTTSSTDDVHATQQGSIIGTPAYMPPEQAAGKTEEITPRSDVYSLGIMLYELLAGQRPFRGEIDALMRKITQGESPIAPSQVDRSVPKPLEAICLKAMSFDPRQRYEQADQLRADLELYLADEPVAAYAEPWWQRTARWMRRHQALATGLGVAAVLLLLGSVVGYFLYSAAQTARLREEHDRLQQLIVSVQADEDAAQIEVQASRYSSAVALLERVKQATQNTPALENTAQRLTQRCDRLRRIAQLTRLADLAEQHAAMDRDEVSVATAERALQDAGVMNHLPDWWQHLPTLDLSLEQTTQVREDTSRLLLLLALERSKLAILTFLGDKRKHYQAVLELVPAINQYHQHHWGGPSHTARILENFCHYQLGNQDKLQPVHTWEPRGPADHFFVGIAHFWLGAQNSTMKVETILPASVSRDIKALGGIDLQTPIDTSLAMLRMASTLEPRRYWTYNWLGWCLMVRNDVEGAAQAFSAAIALRPDQPFAYTQRANVLLRQLYRHQASLQIMPIWFLYSPRCMPLGGNPMALGWDIASHPWVQEGHLRVLRKTMARIVQGLEMGMKQQDESDQIYYEHSRCCRWLRENDRGIRSFAQCLELTTPSHLLNGDAYLDLVSIKSELKQLAATWRSDLATSMTAERWGIVALAHWRVGEWQEARAAVSQALSLDAGESRAHLVQGRLALQENQPELARKAFQSALQKDPDSFLAQAGLARTDEFAQNWTSALEHYRQIQSRATTAWQRVDAGCGVARVLVQLGRQDEALATLKGIEEYAPRTVAAMIKKHFPQARSRL